MRGRHAATHRFTSLTLPSAMHSTNSSQAAFAVGGSKSWVRSSPARAVKIDEMRQSPASYVPFTAILGGNRMGPLAGSPGQIPWHRNWHAVWRRSAT